MYFVFLGPVQLWERFSATQHLRKLFCSLDIVKLLALALTNLVPDLATLVTNLAIQSLGQPRHQTDQT